MSKDFYLIYEKKDGKKIISLNYTARESLRLVNASMKIVSSQWKCIMLMKRGESLPKRLYYPNMIRK